MAIINTVSSPKPYTGSCADPHISNEYNTITLGVKQYCIPSICF